MAGVFYTTTSGSTSAGATSMTVVSASGFPTNGFLLVSGQVVFYTGLSGNTFSGIPATGAGSITATIATGTALYLNNFVGPRNDAVYYGFLTATSFGAQGDGVTDDTQALQNAITYCTTYGVPLYLPSATYKITSTLTANIVTGNLRMFGVANYGTTIQLASGSSNVFHLVGAQGTARCYISDVVFSGPAIFGSAAGQTGLLIDACTNVTIERCGARFSDIGFQTINNCYGLAMRDCTSYATEVLCGLYLVGQPGTGVAGSGSDCYFSNLWVHGYTYGVLMGPNQGGFHFNGGQIGTASTQTVANPMEAGIAAGFTYPNTPDATVVGSVSIGATSITVSSAATLYAGSGTVLINGQFIKYTALSGTTLTVPASGFGSVVTAIANGANVSVCGGVNNVQLNGVSFESCDYGYALIMYGGTAWDCVGCNFNSNHANYAIGAVRIGGNSFYSIGFAMCGFLGNYSGSTLITNQSGSQGQIMEYGSGGGGTANGVSYSTLLSSACEQSGVTNCLPQTYYSQGYSVSPIFQPGQTEMVVGSTGQTITLPLAANNIGQKKTVMNTFTTSGTTTVAVQSGDHLNGTTNGTYAITQTSVPNVAIFECTVQSSLAQWFCISRTTG